MERRYVVLLGFSSTDRCWFGLPFDRPPQSQVFGIVWTSIRLVEVEVYGGGYGLHEGIRSIPYFCSSNRYHFALASFAFLILVCFDISNSRVVCGKGQRCFFYPAKIFN